MWLALLAGLARWRAETGAGYGVTVIPEHVCKLMGSNGEEANDGGGEGKAKIKVGEGTDTSMKGMAWGKRTTFSTVTQATREKPGQTQAGL